MSIRADLHQFLASPKQFAETLPPELQTLATKALTEFAQPRLADLGRPLRPAQEAAWLGLAPLRAGLVLGPPGTGKTFLLAWLAAGHLWAARHAGLPCRIYVCGFTREAIGNLMEDVAKVCHAHLPDVPLGFFGNEPDQGLPDGVDLLPVRPKELLSASRKWLDQSAFIAGGTVWSLYKLFEKGAGPEGDGPTARVFDLVLVDEASQMVLSQGLLALSGLAEHGRVIAAGDDRQLPPIRPSSDLASADGRSLGGSLYTFLKSAEVPEFRLDETYRLNGPLAMPVAELFYDGAYRSAVADRRLELRSGWEQGLNDWEWLILDPESPLVILLHDGPMASTENAFERGIVHHLTGLLAQRLCPREGADLLDAATLWKERLAIITPHRAQNAALRDEFANESWGANPVVETVDRIQGRERDAILAGYAVSDPEFVLLESAFLLSPQRLNVTVTRARSKLILLLSRRLLEVLPSEEEVFDAAVQLREYVYGCDRIGSTQWDIPSGQSARIEFWVRRFADAPACEASSDPVQNTVPESNTMSILRLMYDGDAPTNETLCKELPLAGEDYLYLTATMDLARRRRDLASPLQCDDSGKSLLRFDRAIRVLMRSKRIASRTVQRFCLIRGIRAAMQNTSDAETLQHDAKHWLEALQDLEQRGIDLANGVSAELRSKLVVPSIATTLETLQQAYQREKQKENKLSFEEAARAFCDSDFEAPPLVVMEGFTYLLPLQRHFVERCLEQGTQVAFVHPHRTEQARGFAVMDRTYQPFNSRETVKRLATSSQTQGKDLELLQRSLFSTQKPTQAAGDGSVSLRVYRHRHREVANCLLEIRRCLDEGVCQADDIAVVTRNSGEMQTIFQEEARRLQMQDLLRIEPRTLLLTPLGRFALTLYEIYPNRALRMSANHFETMLASGWLGADVHRTIDSFRAVRAQMFEHCECDRDWQSSLDQLQATCKTPDPELRRAPSGQVSQQDIALWKRALEQIVALCCKLMNGRRSDLGTHIRRLRDELSKLNLHDLRSDERALVEQICDALLEVIGSDSMRVSGEEFGQIVSGLAREYEEPDPEQPPPNKVVLTTPEALDSASKRIVFYLGVDSERVPRRSVPTWPRFTLNTDADIERERYFFLAVVRACKERLHLSYARLGEDQTYLPSPYLDESARLLGTKITDAEPDEKEVSAPQRVPLPVLRGKSNRYELIDLAIFGLCPYRYRLERFDRDARRFRSAFQLPFLAEGVWLDKVFEQLVGEGPYYDAAVLRAALTDAMHAVRSEVRGLFPALSEIAWQGVEAHLGYSFDDLIHGWLDNPDERSNKTPLDWGVSFERAPADRNYELADRGINVASGLHHVLRIGRFLHSFPNALTHQYWLFPKYRIDREMHADGSNYREEMDLFPELENAVAWWREGLRRVVRKTSNVEQMKREYEEFRDEVGARIDVMEQGKFPKRQGAHCDLCPVNHICLGIPEDWGNDEQ